MVLAKVPVWQYAGRYWVSDLNELLALSDLNENRCRAQLDNIARRMFNTGVEFRPASLASRPACWGGPARCVRCRQDLACMGLVGK